MVYRSRAATPNPTLDWEAAREGVDDARYLYTLQQRIVAARKSPLSAARQAADEAQGVLDEIQFWADQEWEYFKGPAAVPTPDALDNLRAALVARILRLQDVMTGAVTAHSQVSPPWADQRYPRRMLLRVDTGLWSRDDCLVRTPLPEHCGGLRLLEQRADGSLCDMPLGVTANQELLWKLDGRTPGWQQRRYWLYFGGDGKTAIDRQLLAAAEQFFAGENLLTNPGFEEAKPGASNIPLGWDHLGPAAESFTRTESASHTGGACVRLSLSEGQRAPVLQQQVPVKGGLVYLLGVWSRIEARQHRGLPVVARAVWQDVQGHDLERDWVVRGDDEPGWALTARRFTAPPEAAQAAVTFHPAEGFLGEVLLDDAVFSLYAADYFVPPRVSCGRIESLPRSSQVQVSP